MLNASRCLDVIDRNYFLSAPLKSRRANESKLVGNEAEGCAEDTQSILHASLEIDRGGFLKVFCRARDFANIETEHHGLSDHLVVEDKIVRVLEQGKCFEQFS